MSELPQGAKVLVMGPNWLGDCVMAEPTIRQLAEARPDLELTLLVPESLQGVFQDNPVIQQLVAYKNRGEHSGMFGRMRLRRELKDKGFDAALVLRNSLGAAYDASRAGIKKRVGYGGFGRNMFLTDPVTKPEDFRERHRSNNYLALLKPFGVSLPEDAPAPKVNITEKELARGEEIISSDGGDPGELLVGLHPSASYGPAKMWGEDRFAALADRLIEDHGATVLLLGTKGESELASNIIGRMRESDHREGCVRNLTGRTPNVASLAAVFARCNVVVGNDSGPVHLAASTGTPTVAIFGSTSANQTGVRGPQVVNLWENLDCSPCFKRECPKEDYMACMDAIPVARAYTAVRELLQMEEPDFEEIVQAAGDTTGVTEDGN